MKALSMRDILTVLVIAMGSSVRADDAITVRDDPEVQKLRAKTSLSATVPIGAQPSLLPSDVPRVAPQQISAIPVQAPASLQLESIGFDSKISQFEYYFRRATTLRALSLGISIGSSVLAMGVMYKKPDRANMSSYVLGIGSIISLGCYIASLVDDFTAADVLAGKHKVVPTEKHFNWQTGRDE